LATCFLKVILIGFIFALVNFIIHAEKDDFDCIVPHGGICDQFNIWNRNPLKIPFHELPAYLAELEELNKHIIHTNRRKLISFYQFRDDLCARKAHGKSIPKHLNEFFEKSELIAGNELASMFE
jgi:hypothetical protein